MQRALEATFFRSGRDENGNPVFKVAHNNVPDLHLAKSWADRWDNNYLYFATYSVKELVECINKRAERDFGSDCFNIKNK